MPPGAAFFENDSILLMNLDRTVGEHARHLMTLGLAGPKPPDAVHAASAALGLASELDAFDGKVARLDGGTLHICTPGAGGPPPPLPRGMQQP